MDRGLRVEVSKLVSFLLRHDPRGLVMDEEGFVGLDELVSKVKLSFPSVDGVFVRRLVEESERKRFEIVGNRIRALYGHSVPVYLRLEEDTSVEWLYHGTTVEAAKEILEQGLKPMKRLWVHLSPTVNIATQVGKRRTSSPVILVVDCAEARKAGLKFYKASDQVYLCEFVPARHIRRLRSYFADEKLKSSRRDSSRLDNSRVGGQKPRGRIDPALSLMESVGSEPSP